VGTVVDISGNAGSGCSPGVNWFGFNFEHSGELDKGPVTTMTTPTLQKGPWSASFIVPSYLGGSVARGPGAPVTPGRYELAAKACKGSVLATTSFRVTPGSLPITTKDYVGIAATVDGQGYWVAQADGTVTAFGDATGYGSVAAGKVSAASPIVGIARTYSGHGYWLVGSNGRVFPFGDARSYPPSAADRPLAAPVTGIAATSDGRGYWLLAADGHVQAFGDARLEGFPNSYFAPYDSIVARPAGGYIVTAASNEADFAYPGGNVLGGGLGTALAATIVGAAVTPSGNGTWETGLDGGVVTIGDAAYYGSVPGESVVLSAPVRAIAGSPDGRGYWLLGADGTIYPFGDAKSFAS
jgi:hypothetical protein